MDIIIYTGPMCPYCEKAKALLQSKSLDYKEIYVGDNPDLMMEMIEKAMIPKRLWFRAQGQV
mgnify:CR=1 FL=1